MKSRSYPAINCVDYSGYKFIAHGNKVYRNIAAKPGALLMIIIPDMEANKRKAKY